MKLINKNILNVIAASMIIIAGVFTSQAIAEEGKLGVINPDQREMLTKYWDAKESGEFTGSYADFQQH